MGKRVLKKLSHQALKKKADKLFSLYIRRRDTESDGWGRCVSCGKYERLQCGHWQKRGWLSLRYHPQAAHGQCLRCNHFLGGNEGPYTLRMIEMYGLDQVKKLMELKHHVVKLNREDYERIIDRFSL